MNKEITPAPFSEETLPKYEKLLSEGTTGAQALLLLGIEPPKQDGQVPTLQKEDLVKSATDGIPQDHKKRLTEASFNERDEYWKDVPANERMEKWRQGFNAFLDLYTKDPTQLPERAFLKTILKVDNLDEVNADKLYNTFILGEGKGDIEFFARRIVDTHTDKIGQIENNQELIRNLAVMYGDNSAKITELLACGIANARHNPDKFIASAQQNLNKKAYGGDIWTPLAEHAGKWEEKKQMTQTQAPPQPVTEPPEPQPQQQPQQPEPSQPEQITPKEFHPLVKDAGAASEASFGKESNQDAHFRDRKHGAFGVFDGLGSYKKSGEVANTASVRISEELARIDPQMSLDETEKQIRKALTHVSEELSREEDARYRAVLEDIMNNATGKMSDDNFDEKYEGPKRERSRAQWIRRIFDPAKPDEINKHLGSWIKQQVEGSTTASVVKLWQGPKGERKAIIANAGDSRVYHYAARDGKLSIVTVDDNQLYDVLGEDKARQIQDIKAGSTKGWKEVKNILNGETIILKQSNPQHLAIWENSYGFRDKYPWNVKGEVEVPLTEIDDYGMTKVIPMMNLEPNIQTIDVEPQDKLIITSDGVHDELITTEIADVLNDPANKDAEKAAEALVKFAKKGELTPSGEQGKLKDDTTAVVVDIS